MKLTKKTLIWVLVIVVAGAALYFLVIKKGGAATAGSDGAPAVQQAASQATPPQPSGGQDTMPLPVKAVPARKGDVTIWLKSPGEAYTERKIVIKAEVGSVIKRFEAAEGRHVTKNALLVELDDREIRLNLHKLEARRLKALSAVLLEKMFSSQGAAPDPALIDKVSKAKTAFEAADASFRKGLVSQDEWEKTLETRSFPISNILIPGEWSNFSITVPATDPNLLEYLEIKMQAEQIIMQRSSREQE